MPANGIKMADTFIRWLPASSHCAPSSAPSGSAVRIRISAVPNSSPNNTPAKAAARGVRQRVRASAGGHGWPGSRRIISPLASASRLSVRVAQFGVDERLAALGPLDPAAHGQRRVDRRHLPVVDVQEAGPADRPSRGVDHHAEHRVEQQRQHAAVHRIVATDRDTG